MATTAPTSTGWTYQRYLELNDDERYEILDGELLMTPAPGTQHQFIAGRLYRLVSYFAEDRKLGAVLPAPTDVVLDGDVVVQPDLLFVRAERVAKVVGERAVNGAPDLVVEVLSPTSIERDRHRKRELYRRHGVREYWLVDPANRAIEVLVLEEGDYRLASFAAESGAVASTVLPGLAVAVAEVFQAAGGGVG